MRPFESLPVPRSGLERMGLAERLSTPEVGIDVRSVVGIGALVSRIPRGSAAAEPRTTGRVIAVMPLEGSEKCHFWHGP